MTDNRFCIGCVAEGLGTRRKASYPGPRCYTHHNAIKKSRSGVRKARHVEKTYSITEQEYQALLAAQAGACYMCRRKPGKKRLAVDHDHSCCKGPISCGKCVRGLACRGCNRFMGYIRDDPTAFDRGAYYLRNPPAQAVLALIRGGS